MLFATDGRRIGTESNLANGPGSATSSGVDGADGSAASVASRLSVDLPGQV
ncbi:hypothetical protein ACQPXH_09450 [Nocardia sp. CA-135953]|uniref:hypothetical protein n=1 Tax=Nocardia sp. CA-135953 TaxID=3239978 RepID=UPI003D95F436